MAFRPRFQPPSCYKVGVIRSKKNVFSTFVCPKGYFILLFHGKYKSLSPLLFFGSSSILLLQLFAIVIHFSLLFTFEILANVNLSVSQLWRISVRYTISLREKVLHIILVHNFFQIYFSAHFSQKHLKTPKFLHISTRYVMVVLTAPHSIQWRKT